MSAFTALNGGSPPKTSEPTNQPADAAARASPEDHRSNGSPTHHEPKAPTAAEATRESWAGPRGQDKSPYHSTNYPDVDGSLKRKRSDSPPQQRNAPMTHERSPDAPAHPSETRSPYRSPPPDHRPREREDQREGDSWYSREGDREDRSYYDHSTMSAQSEDQIGELQRANQMDSQGYDNTSPDGDDKSMPYSPYTPTGGSRDAILQSEKKRKRNFSNRTKTGCMTCRRRKKKCDEQKPECSNCIRGGFVCAGYPPQRNAVWQKSDNKATAIPLESKDPSYVPPGAYGMPQSQPPQSQPQPQPQAQPQSQPPPQPQHQSQPPHQPQPQHPQQAPYGTQPAVGQRREPLSYHRGQPLRIDTPQGRPIADQDVDRQTGSTLSASMVSNPLSGSTLTPSTIPSVNSAISPDQKQLSPSGHPYPFNVTSSPQQQREPHPPISEKRFDRVPPLLDLSRTANDPDTPYPAPTLPQINILHPTRSNSPNPQPPATTNVQVAAQLALSHAQFPANNRIRSQKEEMLSGKFYYPFDKELVLERERCSAACWRFNNSTNPNNGVSPNERARLFREILQPRELLSPSPGSSPVTNIGRVGENVVVEAPFVCDYGYNIVIGQNVIVGRSCTILDAAEVNIGDNCHIGPNVSIYAATLHTDPKRRQGSKGPQIGRPVTIDQDCWIGGGVTILPGITIGKGSTVGAGSVVTKNVPPFTIVGGNPARVLRGIGS
ncbi:putative maltose O-acetyltransferase [Colletotrichum siamense]|uniref:Maltose O-acetyltransferase n=2 Tax=Colletotrichum gloeosporioides species complex TaxID=2707338 RepID=A0A9P5BKS8_COLSI|nr:putative maltose O-acetyltransferase [Colletotrichum siamense]KAF4841827.1 putative maltose O-acetyltransferase [Colletotrichum siamense]KAF4880530.1 putative maltose O-acetyltransferase [Colletotrichum siamense]KAF5487282.1 putative maltose O-acetyltransferase [Colletotrichum siamense]